MPGLRYAEWLCMWKPRFPKVANVSPNRSLYISESDLDDLPIIKFDEKVSARRTVLALRTNLLYDAVSWLNYGVEIPFADNKFSVSIDHQFPWWRAGSYKNKFCMRYLQVSGELRWWFAPRNKPATKHKIVRDCLSGHFLAAYGMGGKWDFQNKRKICYQGEFWSTGLTYGYSLPIAQRLNLEFSASIGYASIPYRHYIPADDYSILYRDPEKTGTWNYCGLTKLGVTLVVPITFNGFTTSKKGELK